MMRAVLVTLCLAAGAVHAEGDAAAGKALFAACAACHGASGEGIAAVNAPALGGQDAGYIARQLANFRSGIRGANPADTLGAQMRGMAIELVSPCGASHARGAAARTAWMRKAPSPSPSGFGEGGG